MFDKKTLMIAVLCVATVLFLGFWSNSALEASTLNSKYVKVVEDYNRLNSDYSKLTSDYSKLNSDYLNLEAEKATLEHNYSLLYIGYEAQKSTYDTLKEEYDKIVSVSNGAKAIAESAEWVSEDGRLKVTSELIISGTWWTTYTVRVNVTNIGNELISKVYIIVFPYKDGKFAETYVGYDQHSIENLYIGESNSYDFTSITFKDMTSYKVLAVVG